MRCQVRGLDPQNASARLIFRPTPIPGVVLIELEQMVDERGFLARTFCAEEFSRNGLNPALSQCSISFNHKADTLRGMHYQVAPFAEAKLVRCTRGAFYDVALDLRKESASYTAWFAQELSAENRRMLYIGEGIAHGFQTLTDDTEVLYQMSAPHRLEASRGVRWNDAAFGIEWPSADRRVMSERDRQYPDFRP